MVAVFLSRGNDESRERDPLSQTGTRSPGIDARRVKTPVPADFVGKDVCGTCHEKNHRFHSESGHARTLRKASDPDIVDKFLEHSFAAGEAFGDYDYVLEAGGLAARSSKIDDRTFPLEWAFGSGHNAITLATLVANQKSETIGIEHRASWFAAFEKLVQTPGQRSDPPQFTAEFFGAIKSSDEIDKCVGCHSTTAEFSKDRLTIEKLRPNVNCERCHGPGSEHVRDATANPVAPAPYSVGRADWTANDEISLCGSCHRMPSEFAAPLLREYANVMARFQPVGLLRSRCYLESQDLRCSTCHNPHQTATAQSRQDYEEKCVRCHQEKHAVQASCPVSPTTHCIHCHMPRVQFVDGIGFHDHWIRVRDTDETNEIMPERPRERD